MASPKLRFKEFSLDWELKSLGSITKWYSGGTPSKDIEDYWGNGYPLISGASMHADLLEESNVHITELGLQNGSKLAPKNSILLLVRGSMLFNRIPVGIAQKDLAFNQDVKCLIPSNGVLYQFIFQWFKSKESFIKNKVTSTGIGAGKLDTDDLQNLSFFQPTEKEQAKIAGFLITIDKKISQLNEQHQLMIQYKKGVMQKIFNQEIRFKDDNGKEFGEWEERILEDVSIIIMGSSPKSENYNELGIGLPLLQGNADIKNRKSCPRNFTTEITKECDVGDILMSVRAPVGYVAKAMHDACIGRGIAAIRVKENNNQEFLYQYLIYMEDIWGKFSQGSTFDSVNSEQIKNLSLFIPCLQEQTKIADFLTKLDDKIEKVALQLEQVKMWKKGLLQQMFV